MRWFGLSLIFLASGAAAQITIRFTVPPSQLGTITNAWIEERALAWAERTGNRVELAGSFNNTDQILAFSRERWEAHDPTIDIYAVDVIWAGVFAPYALDLAPYLTQSYRDAVLPQALELGQVGDFQLALPFFGDVGVLFYRADLLRKYGYSSPPKTWDQLTEMAETIQRRERSRGQAGFWGYVFQGIEAEASTVNALEWLASEGGEDVLMGRANSAAWLGAQKALARAAGWVGTIAPREVLNYREDDTLRRFASGRVAFMRNWPNAQALLADFPQSIGEIEVAPLPGRAVLGGWQLMVSAYSQHPKEAMDLLFDLTSPAAQRQLAAVGVLPVTRSWPIQGFLARRPYLRQVSQGYREAMARPAQVFGPGYPEASALIAATVHRVLARQQTPEEGVAELAEGLARLAQEARP